MVDRQIFFRPIPLRANSAGRRYYPRVWDYDIRNTDKGYEVLAELEIIAKRHHRPMSQVAIAWLMSRPSIASVLLGARTVLQLEENLAASTLKLEAEEITALTNFTAPRLPHYPYQFLADYSQMSGWEDLGT